MTPTQRIALRMSECRQRLNELLGNEQPSAEELAEMDALQKEMSALEIQHRAALVADTGAAAEKPADTGERKDMAALLKRASIGPYLVEALGGAGITGAEKELRAELLGADALEGSLPLDLLLPPLVEHREGQQDTEHRADVATAIGTAVQENQAAIVGRVFGATSGAYLGVERPTVAVGTASYPFLASGTTADARSPGVALDAGAATINTQSVNPVRATARYLFNVEDLSLIRGFEEALAADMRGVLGDKLDLLALRGQAAVADTSPAVEGFMTGITAPAVPGDVAAWDDYLNAFTDAVDGKYSQDGSNVRLLVNPATYKHSHGLQVATSGALLRTLLPPGRFRASANMPPVPATGARANVGEALAYTSGFRGMIQPVWRGVNMIRDPYSNAAAGQVALTLSILFGQKLIDSNVYRRVSFKLA